jgi:hypothetical protein
VGLNKEHVELELDGLVLKKVMQLQEGLTEIYIESELKHFFKDLTLSDIQKYRLLAALTESYDELQELKQNSDLSKEELRQKVDANRSVLRDSVAALFSEQQRTIWEREMTKIMEFLGQKAASA